jgi:glycosyltransferase involved in cell wall biosynthesis
MDERDPTVDFETATGELVVGSSKYEQTLRATRLSEGMSSLVLLTSKAYERLYVSEGFPRGKVMGAFRGVDTALFNPGVDPATVRRRLGLDGKFVIGWFGLMHSFRLIREVLIPMVQNIAKTMPDAHVLIGGEGPLLGEFQDLAKDSGLPLTVLGLVPYSELPSHVAACDVLLCPVNRGFRHTQNSAWLKIAEALAVGRPVIATRTRLSEFDFKELKGVLWVEPTLASFMDALKELREGYPRYLSLAQEQSRNFGDYSISHTISRIVDRIELQLEGPVN